MSASGGFCHFSMAWHHYLMAYGMAQQWAIDILQIFINGQNMAIFLQLSTFMVWCAPLLASLLCRVFFLLISAAQCIFSCLLTQPFPGFFLIVIFDSIWNITLLNIILWFMKIKMFYLTTWGRLHMSESTLRRSESVIEKLNKIFMHLEGIPGCPRAIRWPCDKGLQHTFGLRVPQGISALLVP